MATRPYKVSVQGAKPRKGEALYRRFKHFTSATDFAVQQAGAQLAVGRPWGVENVDTGERWNAFEDGSVRAVHTS